MRLLLNSYFLSQELNANEWLEATSEHLYGHLDSFICPGSFTMRVTSNFVELAVAKRYHTNNQEINTFCLWVRHMNPAPGPLPDFAEQSHFSTVLNEYTKNPR